MQRLRSALTLCVVPHAHGIQRGFGVDRALEIDLRLIVPEFGTSRTQDNPQSERLCSISRLEDGCESSRVHSPEHVVLLGRKADTNGKVSQG